MSEQNPLTISELINSLKATKKQYGNLPVMFYTGKEKDKVYTHLCKEPKVYTHLCKEPKEIKIMIDFCREEGDVLRKFALIKG